MNKFLSLIFFLAFSIPVLSQISDSDKKSQAKENFYYGKYETALSILSNSKKLSKKDKEARLLIGICYFQLNRLDEALNHFNNILEQENNPYPESWLYIAKIYHARHEFEEAAKQYKRYLKTIRDNDPKRRIAVEEIKRCSKGIELQYRLPLAVVENLGAAVNSVFDEFGPILSPNYADKLYFSSVRPGNMGGARDQYGASDETYGEFLSDMFSCEVVKGSWGGVQPMHYLLNSPRHDVLLSFNWDGSVLYYFKGWSLDNGEILLDTFKNRDERTLSSNPFLGPVNTFSGDGTPFFVNDTLVFFSSSRPGGYGGMDIYSASFQKGRWTSPKNLGPVINTAFDESHPFLALDEQTLYFSSNNSTYSIGGMDVFKSIFVKEHKSWTTPFNLGIPINSASDDTDFKLAKDGFTAYFTSSRKDGYGQRDLYIAYFHDFLKEQEPPSRVFVLP